MADEAKARQGGGGKAAGVLVVHGMGTQDPGYAKKMIAELESRLGEDSQHVAWRSVYWADVLSARQREYLDRAAEQGKEEGKELDFIWARRFVVNALSDAVSYRRVGPDDLDNPMTTYGKVHSRVRGALTGLREEVEDDGALAILAHSLGGHIMSNYIWDVQRGKVTPEVSGDSFEGASSLRLLVTFGCNIPLFTFALDKVVPIKLQDGAKWHNYYDRDDVLGYPLRPINDEYADRCEDVEIDVGGFLSSWNFASHAKYWTDNDFTRPVAESIRQVVAKELKRRQGSVSP